MAAAARPKFATNLERNAALNDAALSDALHDFKGARGAARGDSDLDDFSLEKLRRSIEANGIGTVVAPSDSYNEWDCFRALTGLTRDDVQTEGPEKDLTIVAGENPILYKWDSRVIGTKNPDNTNNWSLKSIELLDWIQGEANVKKGIPFYCLIDAYNVKFYAALGDLGKTRRVGDPRKAYFLSPREKLNDAANSPDNSLEKVIVALPEGSPIEIEMLYDEYAQDVVYPATLSREGTQPEKYLFNSIYNVAISPITGAKDKIKSVTTKFFSSTYASSPIVIQKGVAEDKHPNGVNVLLKKLIPFFTKPNRQQFHTTLQQKRSGDWLQVLSTFEPERFKGLAPGTPVFFCTLDSIAAGYALSVGANVIFTYNKEGESCLAVFRRQKDVNITAMYKARIGPDFNRDTLLTCINSYNRSKSTILKQMMEDIERAKAEAETEVERINRVERIIHDPVAQSLYKVFSKILILYLYLFDISNALPDVSTDEESLRQIEHFKGLTREATTNEIKGIKNILPKYETDIANIKGTFAGIIPDTEPIMNRIVTDILTRNAKYYGLPVYKYKFDDNITQSNIGGHLQSFNGVISPENLRHIYDVIRAIKGLATSERDRKGVIDRAMGEFALYQGDAPKEIEVRRPPPHETFVEIVEHIDKSDYKPTSLFVSIQRLFTAYKVESLASRYFTKFKNAVEASLAKTGGSKIKHVTIHRRPTWLGTFGVKPKTHKTAPSVGAVKTPYRPFIENPHKLSRKAMLRYVEQTEPALPSHPSQTIYMFFRRSLYALEAFFENQANSAPYDADSLAVLTQSLKFIKSFTDEGITPFMGNDKLKLSALGRSPNRGRSVPTAYDHRPRDRSRSRSRSRSTHGGGGSDKDYNLALMEALILGYFPNYDRFPHITKILEDKLDMNPSKLSEYYRDFNSETYGYDNFTSDYDEFLRDPFVETSFLIYIERIQGGWNRIDSLELYKNILEKWFPVKHLKRRIKEYPTTRRDRRRFERLARLRTLKTKTTIINNDQNTIVKNDPPINANNNDL